MDYQAFNFFKNQCFIGGQWLEGEKTEKVLNPATGEVLTRVPLFAKQETEQAISAAAKALPDWRALAAHERAGYLKAWHKLIIKNSQELAYLMTLEQGKPIAEALGEINYAASYVEWFAEEATRIYGQTIPGHGRDKRIVVSREPVGVCAAITPWNFPAAMITRKVAPALAAGCPIIVKPALETPLTALALAALAQQAGIPGGVINVVTGNAQLIGETLTASPVVRKLSFTGSTPIGSKLMAACAPTVKNISLELGGNAPFIIFDDADINIAVDELIKSKFRNAGQTCICANRIYVQQGIYQEFYQLLATRVMTLKVGVGTDPDTDIGPLISEDALQKVEQQIANGLENGGQIITGGKRHMLGGTWFEPTVLINANDKMLCAKQETFGPFAPLFSFETEEQVIEQANNTEFGLAAYLFSNNINVITRVSEALEYGMVGINTGLISTAVAPFGGVKSSGFGREGSHFGIDEYTELKYRCYSISNK
jgi:succinate-semialdehyde dehydrogenase / glutarate-semialdehyde dehydrogenase